jgi:diguanylate cyclase
VSETLLNLLSQLVIPERLSHTVLNLQNRLQEGLNWYELVPLLEDTTDFLLECLGNSQTELEQFLQSLDQRLQAIQILVSEASQGQMERKRARLDLDGMVRDQIADIRSVVTGSGDLGELGVSVRDHLTMIVQAMEKYQKEEEEREERLAAKLEMLQARLSEMEQEVSESRVAIEEQRRRATHDNLTGLPNRDAYQARLAEELLRRNRYGGSLALVIGDVDHFKRINDNYGHLAGDKVLQLIARSLRKNLRDVDFIARYGGEEFVILMPETSSADAMVVAEKLRAKIEGSPFNFKKERVPITMSFGVSEFHALESPDAVFDRADKALYQAKNEGRNRICQG